MQYYGPVVRSLLYISDNANFRSGISLGYLGYKDIGEYGSNIKITGSTVGFYMDAGVDYYFNDKLGITGQLSLLRGLLNRIEMTSDLGTETLELEEDQRENLSRIDFGLGLFITL